MRRQAGIVRSIVLASFLSFVVSPSPLGAQIALETTQRVTVFIGPSDVGAGDFDEDGDFDLLYAGSRSSLRALVNDGAGRFSGGAYMNGGERSSARVAIADLNGDGHEDLASAESGMDRIALRYGTGDGRFPSEPSAALPVAAGALDVFASDVDSDGDIDLVAAATSSLVVCLSEGEGVFTTRRIGFPGSFHNYGSIVPTDFDSDGIVDAAFARDVSGRPNVGSVALLRGRGDGSFDLASSFDVYARGSPSIAAGDFDGDGRPDFAITAHLSATIRVHLGGADGSYGSWSSFPLAYGGSDVETVDLDVDGRTDLVATSDLRVAAFRGDGRGGFVSAVDLPVPHVGPVAAVIRDLNGDGLPDVATADSTYTGAKVSVHVNRSLPSCRGTVNAGAGAVTDVLFVGDSAGDADGTVRLATHEPLTIFMAAPPLADGATPFALFAWPERPTRDTRRVLPHGIGTACLPMLRDMGSPVPRIVWNNFAMTAFAPPTHPSTPAPSLVLQRRSGLGRPATFFLQGLIRDPGSAGTKPASVTNGILVEIR